LPLTFDGSCHGSTGFVRMLRLEATNPRFDASLPTLLTGDSRSRRIADRCKRMGSYLVIPDGIASLSNKALVAMLRGLEEEERLLSHRRRLIHDRIDRLQLERADASEADLEPLEALQYQEARLSERRLQVHKRIAELRIEVGDRRRSLRANLTLVE
jgi:predicted DCC family thiol-disulfide oxidoreductase YuxK